MGGVALLERFTHTFTSIGTEQPIVGGVHIVRTIQRKLLDFKIENFSDSGHFITFQKSVVVDTLIIT